ncbi:SoxR reducing system RseC family protein [Pseudoalteromonas phenolica]|uniref:Regulator n=1 Tax=Pseudoalteromonas phenolica TaxID=161398 RepID=A0A0S2K1S0_9GAMM|nr:SoxR reducing system RseC family protein [Pseudoalteromonas phenolica]ALO42455.1 regulator [Pseudoalteromonas phenolica]MBE0356448.1 sigma-E factor negative regulatory protein RseC [Pseudoalteromonas phenolica O-BC30]
MIEQTLSVAKIRGTTAYLQAEPKPACEGCNGKCGSQIFSRLFGTQKKLFPIELHESVEVGQKIKLSLDDSKLVNHGAWVYMTPLMGAFIMMFIGAFLLNLSEPFQILFALMGGLMGFIVARYRVGRLKHQVKVVKIYPISFSVKQIDGD